MDNNEIARLKGLYSFELEELSKGKKNICGIDEAGRGPLAGPVVSGAVILPRLTTDDDFLIFEGLDDSKKLTPKKREKLFDVLISHTEVRIGIGIISEKVIDKINILQATLHSMVEAVSNLDSTPDCLLIDGMNLPEIDIYQRKIIDGDALSLSVAAASIIAKVTRDSIMRQYHEKYPLYGFDRHKGYGTKEHMNRLKEHGACDIHRRTFYPLSLMQEIGM